jgi:succinate dehydrogenase/fumarate reductase flavoprotein subunit
VNLATRDCDVLVVGGGAAGMRAALEAAGLGLRTALVCKSLLGKAATVLAAGPIVARSAEAQAGVRELERWGAIFDRDADGFAHRGVRTGMETLRALQHRLAHARITVYMECPVRRLLLEDGHMTGALAIRRRDGEFLAFRTGTVILATGGAGAAWKSSRAPGEATGDGVALALAAGARIGAGWGVEVDPETTATCVPGLFAAGEVAALPVEGNGVAEALVQGRRAGRMAAERARRPARRVSAAQRFESLAYDLEAHFRNDGRENPYALRAELAECMDDLAGARRNAQGLRHLIRVLADLRARLAKVGVTGARAYNPAWHEALDVESLLAFSESAVRTMLDMDTRWQTRNDISGSGAATPAAAASRATAS